jgi:hypothetical protein
MVVFLPANRDGIRIRDSSHLVLDGFTLVGTGNLSTSRAGISVQSSALGSRLEIMPSPEITRTWCFAIINR